MEIEPPNTPMDWLSRRYKVYNLMLNPIDALIPISAALILIPNNPIYGNALATSWTVLQLIFSPKKMRWAMWPLATVLLISIRSWWLNEVPNLASSTDSLLIMASMVAASGVNQNRWKFILISPLFALPFLLLHIGPKPWTPNPMAGVNPGGYLLGLLVVFAVAWCSKSGKSLIEIIASGLLVILAFILAWQTGSRAALVSSVLALTIIFLRDRSKHHTLWRDLSLLTILGVATLGVKQFLSPSSSGIPGLNISSDFGRILIGKCYFHLPFTGNNRLLFGIGFERPKEFCQQMINGGVADHSHNLFLQIWANSGLLGILGVSLLIFLLLQAWSKAESQLDVFILRAGQAALFYTIFQGIFDVSLLHLPILQVFTGITLSIPFSTMTSEYS